MSDESPVLEVRVALTVDDYDKAFAFWHEALGLPVSHAFGEGDARGVVLDAGRATIEILSAAQAEVGRSGSKSGEACARRSGSPSKSPIRPAPPEGSRRPAPSGSRTSSKPHGATAMFAWKVPTGCS